MKEDRGKKKMEKIDKEKDTGKNKISKDNGKKNQMFFYSCCYDNLHSKSTMLFLWNFLRFVTNDLLQKFVHTM